jgi:hypothetical protein
MTRGKKKVGYKLHRRMLIGGGASIPLACSYKELVYSENHTVAVKLKCLSSGLERVVAGGFSLFPFFFVSGASDQDTM